MRPLYPRVLTTVQRAKSRSIHDTKPNLAEIGKDMIKNWDPSFYAVSTESRGGYQCTVGHRAAMLH